MYLDMEYSIGLLYSTVSDYTIRPTVLNKDMSKSKNFGQQTEGISSRLALDSAFNLELQANLCLFWKIHVDLLLSSLNINICAGGSKDICQKVTKSDFARVGEERLINYYHSFYQKLFEFQKYVQRSSAIRRNQT